MHTREDKISLTNIKDGAAVEMFDEELQRVMANIIDVNTKADAVREITLKVKFKPDEERFLTAMTVECTSKLSAMKSVETSCVVDRGRNGVIEARELVPAQTSFLEPDPDKVVKMENRKEEQNE